jgi:hypothetical protein
MYITGKVRWTYNRKRQRLAEKWVELAIIAWRAGPGGRLEA